jgi:hypothetical protein
VYTDARHVPTSGEKLSVPVFLPEFRRTRPQTVHRWNIRNRPEKCMAR